VGGGEPDARVTRPTEEIVMRTFSEHVIRFALVAATASLGCSGSGGAPSAPPGSNAPGVEHTGSAGLTVQIAPGVVINTVTWTITNAGTAFSESGTVGVGSSNTVSFQVGGLPTGPGYAATLTAQTADGSLTCSGSAPFAVASNSTTAVHLALYCSGAAPDAGSAAFTATTQVCANVNSLSASPTEASPGSAISLAATASAGSVPVVFAWTATAGTFSDPTVAAPVFTCPAAPAQVTVTVTVSPSAAGCATQTSDSVAIDCDALDPTFTNVYADVIAPRCVSCHQPGKSGVNTGMLDMSTQATAYGSLVGVPAAGTGAGASGVTCTSLGVGAEDGGSPLLRVAPGSASSSLLYEKVNARVVGINPPCGSGMPLTGAALTQAQVDLIGDWIGAGATND
jgi:hypothetical protein